MKRLSVLLLVLVSVCGLAQNQMVKGDPLVMIDMSKPVPPGMGGKGSGHSLQESFWCNTSNSMAEKVEGHWHLCGTHTLDEVIAGFEREHRRESTCGNVRWIVDEDGELMYGVRNPPCPVKKLKK